MARLLRLDCRCESELFNRSGRFPVMLALVRDASECSILPTLHFSPSVRTGGDCTSVRVSSSATPTQGHAQFPPSKASRPSLVDQPVHPHQLVVAPLGLPDEFNPTTEDTMRDALVSPHDHTEPFFQLEAAWRRSVPYDTFREGLSL